MKKLLFLLLFVPVLTFGQRTITVTVAESMDTTIWVRSNNITLLELDITGLSANTDSIWVGYSNNKGGFEAANGWPIVSDKDTYEQYVNGSWVNRVAAFTTDKWPGLYYVVRYKVVGSSAGDTFDIITDR